MPARFAAALLVLASLGAQNAPLPKGFDSFYNLDYGGAIAEFKKDIAAAPDDPENYNHLAMAILYREMFRFGALESELVSGTNPFLRRSKMNPSREDQQEFEAAISRSMSLAQARLNSSPRDVRALYALGVAYGFRANYNFLVRKGYMDALRDATTARKLHNKVTELNPSNVDARVMQGVHDYVVGSLPWHIKVLGFLAGFRGDKEEGIRTLEYVAAHGNLNRVDAEVLLCAIYRRESRPRKAVPLLESLISRFPRNYLFRFETAQTVRRLGGQAACPGGHPAGRGPRRGPDIPATAFSRSRRSTMPEAPSSSGTTIWTRRWATSSRSRPARGTWT